MDNTKSARPQLGGAGLMDNSQAVKGHTLTKPSVGFVNGTHPLKNAPESQTSFSHSPLKTKGK